MQTLLYLLFISVLIIPQLNNLGILPQHANLIPELLSGVLLVLGLLWASARKEFHLGFGYIFLFVILGMVVIFGLILNGVHSGTAVAGIRQYFKFTPLFLLPAAYLFSENKIHKQLIVLLTLTLLQMPVALYQRLFQYSGVLTGDVITGTLKGSGILTIYLIAAISLITGLFIKKRLSSFSYLLCLVAMFIPTTINETKATIFLLPAALIVPLLFSTATQAKYKQLFIGLMLTATALAVFVPIYDHYQLQRRDEGIVEFLTTEKRLEGYLERTGRSGSASEPLIVLSKDPTKLLLGLGAGNVSESFLGDQYTGEYYDKYGTRITTTLSQWQWELGMFGTFTTLLIFFLVLRDARYLSRYNDLAAAISLGWIGALAVLALSLVYNRAVLSNEIGMLLWYVSGYIAATASRKRHLEIRYMPVTGGMQNGF